MKEQTKRARRLAILMAGVAGLFGWLNLSGGIVYAQYCSLTCSASAPGTGTAGNTIAFTASASTYYCEGEPSYSWSFGDGTSGSGAGPTHIYASAGTYSWTVTVTLSDATASRSGSITISARTSTVTGVSAASFDGSSFSSEEIVAAFGTGLATTTQVASILPLPTTLAGTTVKVKDNSGTERLAPLFFVSSTQVNYQIPPGTVNGAATMTITSGDGSVAIGTMQIAAVAPGLFTFNSNGQGVPAGYLLRARNGQLLPEESITQLNAQNQWIPRPIDLGPETDLVFLVLYGTGFRFNSGLSTVSAKIGGADAQVSYAGVVQGFIGLDQINVRVPRSLIGRSEVDLVMTADGKTANTVRVNIQ